MARDQLKWNKHIEHIETKLSGAIGALFKLRKYVPQKALFQCIIALSTLVINVCNNSLGKFYQNYHAKITSKTKSHCKNNL